MPTFIPDEDADLVRVTSFFDEKGLRVTRFSRAETQRQQTPDFRVLNAGALEAYCEVKSPNDPWLGDLLEANNSLGVVGGARPDPIFNRLSRQISKAAGQFRAVNSDRSALNILAFVNHDSASHMGDLVEVLTGQFLADSGERISTMPHMIERLGSDRTEVDVYLWFCGKSDRLSGYFVVPQAGDPRFSRVCNLLGIDAEAVERV